jgi:hypothetical protein
MRTPEPAESHIRDPETVLDDVQQSCEAIGLPPLPPELELQMVDALDHFAEQAANPYRPLPPVRGAVVALLRGVASALGEDDLGESLRFDAARRRWWDRGHDWTHTLTGYRFNRWTCTCCGHRVGGRGTEHAPTCRLWGPS